MGDKQNQPFQLSLNASLKIDFQGSRVTSDGGLILVRELDERLGFGDLMRQHLRDPRRGKNTQFPLADLFRQSVYGRLAGYEDVNDDAGSIGHRAQQTAADRLPIQESASSPGQQHCQHGDGAANPSKAHGHLLHTFYRSARLNSQ